MLTTQRATLHTTHGPSGTYDAATCLCTAWQWLETQRRNAPEGADVWDIRWQAQKSVTYLTDLLHTLRAGEYHLSPLQLHGQGNDRKAVWGAQDALVLKWVALSIEGQLPLHPSCEHIKGHGGGKQSIHKLHALLTGRPAAPDAAETHDTPAPKKTAGYAWVCRTDIRGYYRNINKETLLKQVRQHVQDPVLAALINQYIHYTVEDGGTFHTPESGISRGCPLSPLMGALHLYDMDEHFSNQQSIHYARYMDDVIILAKSRWSLRKHTRRLMQWFSEYGFEAHPDKTQIGRTAKGFDWMGAWLTDEGVTDIAPRAKANHREKVRRLYERLARLPAWLRHRRQKQVHARVSAYRKRWNIWVGTQLLWRSRTTPIAIAFVLALYPPSSIAWNITGLPSVIPANAPAGTTVGGVATVTGLSYRTYGSGSKGDPQYMQYPGFYYPGNTPQSYGVANGQAYVIPFTDCPSLGLVPDTVSIDMTADDSSATALGGVVIPGTNLYSTYALLRPKGEVHWYPHLTGHWILATGSDDPNFKCVSYSGTSTGLQIGIIFELKQADLPKQAPTTTVNGAVVIDGTGWSPFTWQLSTPPTGAPVTKPTLPTTCTISTSVNSVNFGDGKGGATGPISASDINSRANVEIAAITPSPITVTATCTGGTGTPKIHGHITWTNPKKWTAGFSGGLPADADPAAPAMLASARAVAYGEAYNVNMFDSMKSPLQFGDDFLLTPGTAKKLYPALLRDNNPKKYVTSGTHTVTGTIKVVID